MVTTVTQNDMSKKPIKNRVGRPSGASKKPLNIYLEVDRLDELKKIAKEEQRNISTVVGNALNEKYGI